MAETAEVERLRAELVEARVAIGLVRLEADKLASVPGGGVVRKMLAARLRAILAPLTAPAEGTTTPARETA